MALDDYDNPGDEGLMIFMTSLPQTGHLLGLRNTSMIRVCIATIITSNGIS